MARKENKAMAEATVTLRRPLALSEAIYRPSQLTTLSTGTGTGTIDVPAMTSAFEAVREEWPILAGRIEDTPDGPMFVVPENPPPGSVRVRHSGVDETPHGTDALLDPSVELAALHLVNEGSRFRFTMLVYHGVCDGHGALACALRVLAQYAALRTTGELLPFERRPLPQSLETALSDRKIAAGPESGLEKILPLLSSEPPPEVVASERPRLVRMRLTASETDALKALGKKRGVGMHGLITGIFALTEHDLAGRPPSLLVPVYTIVNIRERIDPPISPFDGTAMLGFSVSVIEVTGESDVFEVGKKIAADLDADLASGLVQQSHLHLPALLARLAEAQQAGCAPTPKSMVSLSNMGSIPAVPESAGLAFEDCYGSTENLTPAELGQPERPDPKQYNRAYVIVTYAGRVCVEFKTQGSHGVRDGDLPLCRTLRAVIDRVLAGA
jgi:hypothetical protein